MTSARKITRKYGIEFELEGVRMKGDVPDGWHATHDGTLRSGGVEFVSTVPSPAADVLDSSQQLFASLRGFEVSHRCSTHIHVNAPTSAVRRLCLYAGLLSLEAYIFSTYAPARSNNNYCVPGLRSVSGFIGLGVLMGRDQFVGTRDHKYSATNYAALDAHGTIELRHFSPLVELGKLSEVLALIESVYDRLDSMPPRPGTRDVLRALTEWEDHPDPAGLQWVLSALDTHQNN